jgi:hypothetical protein
MTSLISNIVVAPDRQRSPRQMLSKAPPSPPTAGTNEVGRIFGTVDWASPEARGLIERIIHPPKVK